MRAGLLNRRINIERRATTQDALGQPSESWTLVAAVWADIRHLGGLESIKAGADTSVVRASIRIRYRTGLDAGMRVTHGADTYDVRAVLPDTARREYVDLVCEMAS